MDINEIRYKLNRGEQLTSDEQLFLLKGVVKMSFDKRIDSFDKVNAVLSTKETPFVDICKAFSEPQLAMIDDVFDKVKALDLIDVCNWARQNDSAAAKQMLLILNGNQNTYDRLKGNVNESDIDNTGIADRIAELLTQQSDAVESKQYELEKKCRAELEVGITYDAKELSKKLKEIDKSLRILDLYNWYNVEETRQNNKKCVRLRFVK